MDAAEWDERYRATDLVWSAGPNRFLVEQAADLTPGSALDVACGEGRNACWLADQGWTVRGSDFSPVAIGKARAIARRRGLDVTFDVDDATTVADRGLHELVLVFYLHLPPAQRRAAHRAAAAAVAPGGTLLVVGHHRRNLTEGVGGPRSADVLLTRDRVLDDLVGTGLVVDRAEPVHRVVETADGPRTAVDLLVRGHRPATGSDRPDRSTATATAAAATATA